MAEGGGGAVIDTQRLEDEHEAYQNWLDERIEEVSELRRLSRATLPVLRKMLANRHDRVQMRRLFDRRTGMMAACILGTMPQYFYLARQAMPDMLLTVFLIGALGLFAVGRFDAKKRTWHLRFGYAFIALAVLTKGPVAGAIVIGICGLFWLIEFVPRTHLHWRRGPAESRPPGVN